MADENCDKYRCETGDKPKYPKLILSFKYNTNLMLSIKIRYSKKKKNGGCISFLCKLT